MASADYLSELFQLQGKVVAIVGAGGLLCGAMAEGFAQAGCDVALLDANKQNAQAKAEELSKGVQSDHKPLPLQVNISIKSEVEKALADCLDYFGKVDVLINGAGINAPTSFFEITEQEWDRIFDVVMKGTLFGCQVFGRYMVERGAGSIINISSTAAEPPLSKAYAYSASKAGVRNLTQNIAREFAPSGVRVNSLRPGFFPTEWNRKNFITKEREAQILGHTPMKRYGEPHELLGAVLWLASDASKFVTGADIKVDGGFAAMTI